MEGCIGEGVGRDGCIEKEGCREETQRLAWEVSVLEFMLSLNEVLLSILFLLIKKKTK